MDHRVAKDMISSGMIPSGEKKKEDLSRTQYGSTPSPSSLADAYKKMYEENGMGAAAKKDTPPPPAKKEPPKGLPSLKAPLPKTVNPDDAKRERLKKIMADNESVDLLAAYRSIYEHHKKDADGNTIPHEDDVKEGKEEGGYISNVSKAEVRNQRRFDKKGSGEPTGTFGQGTSEKAKLAAQRTKEHEARRGVKTGSSTYTPSSQTEDFDVFDTVVNHFLNEGYQRDDIIKAMSTVHLTEEQLMQEDFGISAILAGTAAALAKGAAVAGKAAMVGGKVATAAAKGGMAAAKGVGTATKGIVSAAKPVVGAATKGLTQVGQTAGKGLTKVGQTAGKVGTNISQNVSKVGQKVADTTSNVGQQVKKVATTAKDNVGQKIQDIAQGTDSKPQKTVKDRVIDFGKKKGEEEIMKDRPLNKTNKTGTSSARQTDLAASADLFDIVKGRLLDEGLSEEEIKDIMLSLTPDEILNEMGDYPMGKGGNYRETPKPNKPEPKPGEDGSRYDAKGRKRYNPANYNRLSGKTSKFDEPTTEEYKNFDPKKPDPKQVAAQARQEKIRQKNNDPLGVKNTNIGGQGLDPMDK